MSDRGARRYSPEYVSLAGEHLDKVDDRIRRFDLEIEGLIRDAEAHDVEPEGWSGATRRLAPGRSTR